METLLLVAVPSVTVSVTRSPGANAPTMPLVLPVVEETAGKLSALQAADADGEDALVHDGPAAEASASGNKVRATAPIARVREYVDMLFSRLNLDEVLKPQFQHFLAE